MITVFTSLNMNLSKTKFIIITKTPNNNVPHIMNNQSVEKVYQYKYLGTGRVSENETIFL